MINCSKWDQILALGPLLFPFEWWSRNSRVFPTVKQDKDPSDLQRYFPFSQNMSNSKMLQKLQVWVYPNDPNQQCRMIQFLPPKWKGNNWFLKMIAKTWKVKTWGKLKWKLVWTKNSSSCTKEYVLQVLPVLQRKRLHKCGPSFPCSNVE